MQNKFKNFAITARLFWSNTTILQDSSTLYISNLVTAGVSFISSIIIARILGPSSYAIIAGYNAIVITLVGFTDFGLGTGLIKHTAPYLKKGADRSKAVAYLKSVFYIELLIGLILLVAGLILAPFIPKLLDQNGISTTVVRLAVVSASIASTTAYVSAVLAAYKKFKLNAIISILFGVLKLITTVILWQAGALTIPAIIGLYVFLSIFNAIVGFAVIPKDYLKPAPKGKLATASKHIFHFSIWLTMSFFMNSIIGKLDFFYLLRIKGAETAGVYAAAQQMSQVYTLLLGAIGTVLTTHVSEKVDYDSKIKFLKKSLPIMGLAALGFVVSGLLAPFIINLFFGAQYSQAAQPLQILIVHLALNLILLPISLLFIPLGKVKVGTFITGAQFVLSLILYPFLITKFGINGAALTIVFSTLTGVVIYPIALMYYMNKQKKGTLKQAKL